MALALAVPQAAHSQSDIREGANALLVECYRLLGRGVRKDLLSRVSDSGVRPATIEVCLRNPEYDFRF
jgi:hypothetical protein